MAGIPVALDYAGVAVAAGALALDLEEDLLARLRVMEVAAAAVFVERART